jgi:hypothetical protein
MSREVAARAAKWQADNLQAALIIIAAPERFGGEEALAVRWARLVVAAEKQERRAA